MARTLGPGVQIIGVNAAGQEDGNTLLDPKITLPWLQDTETVDAWGLWGAYWRDLILVDTEGAFVEVYNLTYLDLADPQNEQTVYDALEALKPD